MSGEASVNFTCEECRAICYAGLDALTLRSRQEEVRSVISGLIKTITLREIWVDCSTCSRWQWLNCYDVPKAMKDELLTREK